MGLSAPVLMMLVLIQTACDLRRHRSNVELFFKASTPTAGVGTPTIDAASDTVAADSCCVSPGRGGVWDQVGGHANEAM